VLDPIVTDVVATTTAEAAAAFLTFPIRCPWVREEDGGVGEKEAALHKFDLGYRFGTMYTNMTTMKI